MDLSRSLVVLAFTGAVVLPVSPAAAACEVTVADFSFSPSSKTVSAGTTVEWCWDDGGHSVTFTGGPDSGVKTAGATYQRTFSAPGTYNYVCSIHGSMQGSITVPGTTTPSATKTTSPKPSTKPPAPTTRPPATTAPPTRIPTPTATTASPTTVAPTTAPPTSPTTSPAALDIDPAPAKPKTGLAIAIGLVFAAAAFGTAGWLLLRGRSGQA